MKFTIALAVVILLVGVCQAAFLPEGNKGPKFGKNLSGRGFSQLVAKRQGGSDGQGQGQGQGKGDFYEALFTPAADLFWAYLGKCGEVYNFLQAYGEDMSAIEDDAPTLVEGCEGAYEFYLELEAASDDEKALMMSELEEYASYIMCYKELSNAELWALEKGGPTAEEQEAYELAKSRCALDSEEGSDGDEETGPPNKRSKMASMVSKLKQLLKKGM